MKSHLTLHGSLCAGTSFAAAASEMQAAANRLGVAIRVEFNEVTMTATPGGSAEWLEVGAFARRLKPHPYFNGHFSHTRPDEADRALVAEAYAKLDAESLRVSREFLEGRDIAKAGDD